MLIPAARAALLEALRSDDERQVIAALKLCEPARDPEIIRAVEGCLRYAAPGVVAAAIDAMDRMGITDHEHAIDGLLSQPDPELRRAAVRYLLSRAPDRIAIARRLLDGDDPELRQCLLDALVEHPYEARSVISWSWIDSLIDSGSSDELLLAARALGAMEGSGTTTRLLKLLSNADIGVRRVALESAARRPAAALLDTVLPLLTDSELSYEAREAVAAVGDAAVPRLAGLLSDGRDERVQARAAHTLSRIASPLAVKRLTAPARSVDSRLRHLGLLGLMRVRVRTGRPVVLRRTVHRLFLREVRDYRSCLAPIKALAASSVPAVRLLSESYRESAERALERGVHALACWYDPRPLLGVLDRLRSRDPKDAAPALEYLAHVLPSPVFEAFAKAFEDEPVEPPQSDRAPEELATWVRLAWESGDGWLRACAVRASRYAPGFDPRTLVNGDADPLVVAEIAALSSRDRFSPEP
jgi:HPt (histidine-containing phosphotransfer) domain-containing protein